MPDIQIPPRARADLAARLPSMQPRRHPISLPPCACLAPLSTLDLLFFFFSSALPLEQGFVCLASLQTPKSLQALSIEKSKESQLISPHLVT